MNQKSNTVAVAGKIVTPFTYSHQTYGEKFFEVQISAARESGTLDTVNAVISEKIVDVAKNMSGTNVGLYGQIRSHNKADKNGRKHVQLYVFVQEIQLLDEVQNGLDINSAILDGYICKTPVYRKTPLGREISDLIIAVNRPYGKADYIPCISWGRNAVMSARFNVGDRVKVVGRLQSREYQKKLSETETETRVAYEVSVRDIEIDESEDK